MTQSQKIYATRLAAAVVLACALVLFTKISRNGEAFANPVIPAPAQGGQPTPPNTW